MKFTFRATLSAITAASISGLVLIDWVFIKEVKLESHRVGALGLFNLAQRCILLQREKSLAALLPDHALLTFFRDFWLEKSLENR